MSYLSALLDIFASVLGITRKRQELKNSPALQRNAAAKTDDKLVEQARDAVADRDLDRIRKLTSE